MKKGVLCKYCTPLEGNEIYCQKMKKNVLGYKCGPHDCKHHQFIPKAYIPVGRCDMCPMCETERTIGAGYAFDYLCKACGKRKIVGYVEWDSEIPEIPDWCPFRAKENQNG